MARRNKIALGTAQFGMNYGINNKRGKIPREEVFAILNAASKFGIDTIDTAYLYGESEKVIGEFLKENKKEFKIVSKLPKCDPKEVEKLFYISLETLNTKKLYGYLIHSFQHYRENPEIWNIFKELKSEGRIKKIGFSLYYPYELDYIFENNLDIDIIQVPYNLFDRRFEPYFQSLKNDNVEIHVRSVFLQGIVFKNPTELDKHFTKIKDKLVNLNLLSVANAIPIVALCLNFSVLNTFIDKTIVGVDGIRNFNEIVECEKYTSEVENVFPELLGFRESDEDVILPLNWK